LIPRLSCVYCGARIVQVYDRTEGHWIWPSKLACVKHADLPALDVRYYGA
jgi:hypothetical protein